MLVGAGLLVRSLQRLFAIDPGFRAENLLIVPLELPRAAYAAAQDTAGHPRAVDSQNQYFAQLANRVKALPGVESATTVRSPPEPLIAKSSVVIEAGRLNPAKTSPIDESRVGQGYHELLGFRSCKGALHRTRQRQTRPVPSSSTRRWRAPISESKPTGQAARRGPNQPWPKSSA